MNCQEICLRNMAKFWNKGGGEGRPLLSLKLVKGKYEYSHLFYFNRKWITFGDVDKNWLAQD